MAQEQTGQPQKHVATASDNESIGYGSFDQHHDTGHFMDIDAFQQDLLFDKILPHHLCCSDNGNQLSHVFQIELLDA